MNRDEQSIETGRRVDVYRNLNQDCLSVKAMSGDDYGTVIGHTHKILIDDPSFVIQESGQRRCRADGVRNVHAFVRGDIAAIGWNSIASWAALKATTDTTVTEIEYDPFEHDTFVRRTDGTPIDDAVSDPHTALITRGWARVMSDG